MFFLSRVYFRFEKDCYCFVYLISDFVTVIDRTMANRTRSAAWEFFSKTGNANLAKCHICCTTIAYSGTTNLLKHLRARHNAVSYTHLTLPTKRIV